MPSSLRCVAAAAKLLCHPMSETFELKLDAQKKLTLTRPGEADVQDVRLRRAFPWSHTNEYISVRTAEGKELLLIDDLAMLGDSPRKVVSDYLAKAIFIPRI